MTVPWKYKGTNRELRGYLAEARLSHEYPAKQWPEGLDAWVGDSSSACYSEAVLPFPGDFSYARG